jgi:Tfp pilus assembly protein PilO
MLFHALAVAPLEARNAQLVERLAPQAPRADAAAPPSSAEKVGAVYAFLKKDEEPTDWLAKLHGIGAATGVQMKSASYRSQRTDGPIARYEIVLPVTGTYPQIRDFLRRALEEIPVLSVDQLSVKRESRNDATVQTELRMTLHMVKA